ncbi:helix-turn-helix domain-containing protein [Microbacterium proteolyticum]|uniref:helix-turn-helix domain-containing protein n=1 Tax=Microbacterium proteolyticum TaxID=1572644 RepID=UPI0035BF51FA
MVQALDGRSVRSVAAEAGLDEGTLRRALAGATWPDLHTVAALEECLGVPLYPPSSRGRKTRL